MFLLLIPPIFSAGFLAGVLYTVVTHPTLRATR